MKNSSEEETNEIRRGRSSQGKEVPFAVFWGEIATQVQTETTNVPVFWLEIKKKKKKSDLQPAHTVSTVDTDDTNHQTPDDANNCSPATKSKDKYEITLKWQHLYSALAPASSPTWLAAIQLLHKSLIQLCYFSSSLPSLSSLLFSRHRNLNLKKKKKSSLSHFVCI